MGSDIQETTAWAAQLLRSSLRQNRRLPAPSDDVVVAADGGGPTLPHDPEKLRYVRELIGYVLDGRALVAKYNLVLLALLAAWTAHHWWCRRGDRLRCQYRQASPPPPAPPPCDRTPSPGLAAKLPTDGDLEHQPLLGASSASNPPPSPAAWWSVRPASWLMYQPRPLPLVHRTLPANGTSLLVLLYLGLNVFFQFFRAPLEARYFFAFAERAGCVFVANLPLLYLLAAKNQPLHLLTGHSYESLNILHRRVGEWMCFVALVHFGGMVVWEEWCSPDWLRVGDLVYFLTRNLTLLGLGAFLSYELLFVTSLGSFRARCYELFLLSHVVLQVAALVFLYLHFWTSRPYVLAALAIFLLDRLVWRWNLKTAVLPADVRVLPDGETLLLSADWDIARSGPRFRQGLLSGWEPMDHVFVTIPSLGPAHSLQAHPFTIASAAPGRGVATGDDAPRHAWFSLLIRAQSGFTRDLLSYAASHPRIPVRFDGPYGCTDVLHMLRARDSIVLIAGGSGIAVVFPLAWALTRDPRWRVARHQEVHLVWIVQSQTHYSWVAEDRLAELREAGVQITTPVPTSEAGRPDIAGHLADLCSDARAHDRDVGVVVSGPDSLNRAARNACAHAVRHGASVQVSVEKFGW